MNPSNDSLPAPEPSETAAQLAAALAPAAAAGHFDELRGTSAPARTAPTDPLAQADSAIKSIATNTYPTSAWADFFDHMGAEGLQDLDRRMHSLQRQVRDNGITYNVYADADGPQRPWSVDLFPLILSQGDWATIERGVLQRVRLLDRVMADVYGPQDLLRQGLLPSALV
ncbi:MAG: A circularly permuted ATPgrasp family protein, partial [Comamonadaceae bacterium]